MPSADSHETLARLWWALKSHRADKGRLPERLFLDTETFAMIAWCCTEADDPARRRFNGVLVDII